MCVLADMLDAAHGHALGVTIDQQSSVLAAYALTKRTRTRDFLILSSDSRIANTSPFSFVILNVSLAATAMPRWAALSAR